MPIDHDRNRRKVLRLAGGLATGLAVTAGAASANDDDDVTIVESLDDVDTSDCDCTTEGNCFDECSDDPNAIQAWERECCTCDGDTVCEDWYRLSFCCA